MAVPNKTGGAVHTDRKQMTPYNSAGSSRALFANQPNEQDWAHDGLILDNGEEARQCAAATQFIECPECSNVYFQRGKDECPECGCEDRIRIRCTEIAVPGYMTCGGHGGGFKQKPEVLAKAHAASVTTGLTVKTIMYCPCKPHGDSCRHKGLYHNADGISQCFPEKQMYDAITEYFSTHYTLDDAADLLMLDRLAMTLIRMRRAERLVAEQGEVAERVRTSGDGSVERWYEPNAAGAVAEKLDKRLQSWLKELAMTKAAREGTKHTVSGSIDLAHILTQIPKSEGEVIDL